MKRMKRLVAVSVCAVMMLTGCSTTTPPTTTPPAVETADPAAKMTPGTYTSVGTGFKGDITVNVTVTEDAITEIAVGDNHETYGIGAAAMPVMIEDMLEYQTYSVDSVAGATVTSAGFRLAVKDALTQAGADMTKFGAGIEKGELTDETIDADIVVVGAGGAGMMAAYYAAKEGYNVVIIEKTPSVGGASAMAGGTLLGTDSKWQDELGYEDSTDALKARLLAQGHNQNHEPTVDLYMSFIADNFNWIVDEDGGNMPYNKTGSGATFSMDGSGTAVMQTLKEKMLAAGATLYTSTRATELIVDNGTVVGVKATGKEANYTINARAVVLATGGYGHNTEIVPKEYQTSYRYSGHSGHDGDALKMIEAVDGATRNIPWVNRAVHSMILPSGAPQYTNMGYVVFNEMSGILINEKGERFAAEVGNDWDLLAAMDQNERHYLFMDQENYDAFNNGMSGRGIFNADDPEKWTSDDYKGQPFYKKGATIEELAAKIDVPADALKATMEKFNATVNSGATEDEYGRPLHTTISEEGPYYALEMSVRYSTSLGGICINDNMQVLNTSEQPVAGLYAAGEVVGGVQGDLYLPSSTFTWTMTSGVQVGKVLSKDLAE